MSVSLPAGACELQALTIVDQLFNQSPHLYQWMQGKHWGYGWPRDSNLGPLRWKLAPYCSELSRQPHGIVLETPRKIWIWHLVFLPYWWCMENFACWWIKKSLLGLYLCLAWCFLGNLRNSSYVSLLRVEKTFTADQAANTLKE